MFKANGWTANLNTRRVTAPDGSWCVSRSVRIIDSNVFIIAHPLYPDIEIDTRFFKTLFYKGDLRTSVIVKKKTFVPIGGNLKTFTMNRSSRKPNNRNEVQ